jgi:hypothetical protein
LLLFLPLTNRSPLATFIYNNYKQSLAVIRDDGALLATLEAQLKVGPEDFKRYLVEQREHLQNLKTEPAEYTLKINYVKALQTLDSEL